MGKHSRGAATANARGRGKGKTNGHGQGPGRHPMVTRTRRAKQYGGRQPKAFTPDSADFDTRKLEHQLASRSLYIKDVSGDGNCLFRALADQLGHNARGADKDRHKEIRQDVVAYLRAHPDEFAVFVEEDFDAYLGRMAVDGTYGDNLEIVAFARRYGRYVKIYQPDLVYVVSPDDGGSSESDASVSASVADAAAAAAAQPADAEMLHIAYHAWEHYSSVRNRDGPHDGPPMIRPEHCDVGELDLGSASQGAPASDMEKVVMASCPGISQEKARDVLREFGGNVNRAVDHLLDERDGAAWEDERGGEDDQSGEYVSANAADDHVVVKENEEPTKDEPSPRQTRAAAATATAGASPGKRPSARDRKEQAKRAQKAAALDRKRRAKSGTTLDLAQNTHKALKTSGDASPGGHITTDVRTLRI